MTTKAIEVWTDGSGTTGGPWGWAALLHFIDAQGEVHEQEIAGHGEEGTNNVAELTAAIEGLNALERPSEVTVFTDSRYVKDGFAPSDGKPEGRVARWKINGWKCGQGDVKNRKLWEQLDAAVARHQAVLWQHVTSHSGVPKNERVDLLAGEMRTLALGLANGVGLHPVAAPSVLGPVTSRPQSSRGSVGSHSPSYTPLSVTGVTAK